MAFVFSLHDNKKLPASLSESHWAVLFDYLKKATESPSDVLEQTFSDTPCKIIPLRHTYNLCVPFFEAHRTIVDVHYCLTGEEIINVAETNTLQELKAYDTSADVTIYHSPTQGAQLIHLKPGDVVLLYPDDAHQPLQEPAGAKTVEKIIVKVPLIN